MDRNKKEQQDLTLEEAFEQLNSVVEELERRDITLEDSFRSYQEGMNLLKLCNEKIDQVEKKILMMNGDGELEEFR